MFKVKQWRKAGNWSIVNKHVDFMHRDGEVVSNCPQYWPTREQAQAVLDRYQPPHVWEHGDVFENVVSSRWIYLCPNREAEPIVVNLNRAGGGGTPATQLAEATFLFNIKDKL
jgi:hypothetical protein